MRKKVYFCALNNQKFNSMKANIFTLTSPIHNKTKLEEQTKLFVGQIQEQLNEVELEVLGDDFSKYGTADLDLIYVRTGGTEGIFLKKINEYSNIKGKKIYLLTNGKSNSLAASMEILSYIRQNGLQGEIIHGSERYIADRIVTLTAITCAKRNLMDKNIGIIGQPSDWLISSEVNPDAIKDKLGMNVINIPMDELLSEIHKHDYPISARKRLKACPSDYFVGALEIYGALTRLIKKYELSGLTIRCFDLLTTVHNTGCLALALLNQEGIPSSCEGDVPALLSMMIAQQLSAQTGFQANPAKINPETGELLFAHCTVPLNMINNYQYDTHFESGIGVALHGVLPTGEATLFKVSGKLDRAFVESVSLTANQYEQDLCRTQVILKAPTSSAKYFLNNPIGNHHIILNGNYKNLLECFFESLSE